MESVRRDLSKEINDKLTYSEYQMVSEYLDQAVRYSDQALKENTASYDGKIRNLLICAMEEYFIKGEYDCVEIMEYYIKLY